MADILHYNNELIIRHNNGSVEFFVNDETGLPNGYKAESVDEAKKEIDRMHEDYGGWYNCRGDLFETE